jgi:hypothetical protein
LFHQNIRIVVWIMANGTGFMVSNGQIRPHPGSHMSVKPKSVPINC